MTLLTLGAWGACVRVTDGESSLSLLLVANMYVCVCPVSVYVFVVWT